MNGKVLLIRTHTIVHCKPAFALRIYFIQPNTLTFNSKFTILYNHMKIFLAASTELGNCKSQITNCGNLEPCIYVV